MGVTIQLESGKVHKFRPCVCGTGREPRLHRDFQIGFSVYCPACGLTTLPEIREAQAVSGWDIGVVRKVG